VWLLYFIQAMPVGERYDETLLGPASGVSAQGGLKQGDLK
jgi:hypothetical protein